MKKLGKNKKKQWRNCYKGLEDNLEAAKNRGNISQGDFVIGRVQKPKQPIIKGNKDAAKVFTDIPSVPDGQIRMKRYRSKNVKLSATDLWQKDPMMKFVANDGNHKIPKISLPLAGQSYNPSVFDHYEMLSALGAQETRKEKRELKTQRFLHTFSRSTCTNDPVEDARTFLNILSGPETVEPAEVCDDSDEISRPHKSQRANKTKSKKLKMSTELNNIPRYLKEMKLEDRARAERKTRLLARKAQRKQMLGRNWDIPFQMPNELVPSLRKLIPEGDLLRELERRKNRCPRARRTLGRLNEVTQNTIMPIPSVVGMFDKLQQAKLFTMLDLRSGCWQMAIEPAYGASDCGIDAVLKQKEGSIEHANRVLTAEE
ncbi:uncharacterized protein DEA37_0006711 [Paragonimus westermani]|uniref:Ribosome biogenesis protein NOP53 n=1 Tax=Paragonimus westermani TaxID=34504 RepID=A0A5J4NLN8_9TREM|nr:uncharacterized protein DEA37_0006711 [Paragonimus westermani]